VGYCSCGGDISTRQLSRHPVVVPVVGPKSSLFLPVSLKLAVLSPVGLEASTIRSTVTRTGFATDIIFEWDKVRLTDLEMWTGLT